MPWVSGCSVLFSNIPQGGSVPWYPWDSHAAVHRYFTPAQVLLPQCSLPLKDFSEITQAIRWSLLYGGLEGQNTKFWNAAVSPEIKLCFLKHFVSWNVIAFVRCHCVLRNCVLTFRDTILLLFIYAADQWETRSLCNNKDLCIWFFLYCHVVGFSG